MRQRFVTFFLSGLIVLSGCNGTGDSSTNAGVDSTLSRSSVVASSSPEFARPTGAMLHWFADLIWAGKSLDPGSDGARMLQSALEAELATKGYRFTDEPAEADYDILAVAVVGDIAAHPDIERLFRLYPSLRGGKGYDSGNLLVAIAPAGTTDIVWRGAIEVFTDEDLSTELRNLRIRKASEMLLGSVPPAPQH